MREVSARERLRLLKDRVFGLVMGIGGIAVIIAILLIFFYLFYTVLPLFAGAKVHSEGLAESTAAEPPALLALEEYAEIGLALDHTGGYRFFGLADGATIDSGSLLGAGSGTAVAAGAPVERTVFAGTDDGRVIIARASYQVSYPDDVRRITPSLGFPFGEEPLVVSKRGAALRRVAGQANDDEASVAATTADGRLLLLNVLWGKVWYEGRRRAGCTSGSPPRPRRVRAQVQPDAADFRHPQGAFYAMLFAMPLAMFGAIYTAYFMSPRRCAAWSSRHRGDGGPADGHPRLPGRPVAGAVGGEQPAGGLQHLLLMPPMMMLAAPSLWPACRPPCAARSGRLGGGAADAGAASWSAGRASWLSPLHRIWFFDGSAPVADRRGHHLRPAQCPGRRHRHGLRRHPDHLLHCRGRGVQRAQAPHPGLAGAGRHALADVTRVVLLTASPGIFSAVMIGFGRAVGETMIVLMATGNSPVMNFNIFEGMRTLSANIAVEMPEPPRSAARTTASCSWPRWCCSGDLHRQHPGRDGAPAPAAQIRSSSAWTERFTESMTIAHS
jgi:hypothetical protein